MESKPPPNNPNFYPVDYPPPYETLVHSNSPAFYNTTTRGSTTYVHPAPPAGTTFVHQTTSSTSPHQTYGSIPVVIQPTARTDVIFVGGCPACRVGVLNEEFTVPGLCCALLFFPVGFLCCILMREKRCSNCNAVFS